MDARDKWKPGASRPLTLVPTTRSPLVGGCIGAFSSTGAIHAPAPRDRSEPSSSIKRDSRRIKSHNPSVKGVPPGGMERSTWSYPRRFHSEKYIPRGTVWIFLFFLLSLSFSLCELLRGSARSIPLDHSAREVRFVQIRNALIHEEIRGAAQESKVRLSERGFTRLFSSVYFPASCIPTHPTPFSPLPSPSQ